MEIEIEKKEKVWTIILNRPSVKNAVDGETASQLFNAFQQFEDDETASVAVLWGVGGTFCAGGDLKAFSGKSSRRPTVHHEDMSKSGPMGPSRMKMSKPVIAAVSGYAVAGGLELACWCDIRVVEKDAVFGVYCRRFGVPLIDGGTQRLPRLIGMSRALDMIITGREVRAEEALTMGLANYVVPVGEARTAAEELALKVANLPPMCMKNDRLAVYEGYDLPMDDAMALEFELGMKVIESGESFEGATRFSEKMY